MPDTDSLSIERQRLLLDIRTISAINDALKVLDYDRSLPLEKLHGTVCIEVVKGQIVYTRPAPSIPVQGIEKRKRIA